jgi:hypothetical protein
MFFLREITWGRRQVCPLSGVKRTFTLSSVTGLAFLMSVVIAELRRAELGQGLQTRPPCSREEESQMQ